MSDRVWLSPPHMCGEEEKYIRDAFDTNWISPMGPNIDGFEADLGLYLKTGGVTALSSGTAAIHLALLILGIQQGDIVICSSFTFSASVNPITYLGAIPVLIDSEPETWNMDPALLEKAIKDLLAGGQRPKAIILVHLYGMPAKLDEIMKIAEHYEIPVIEDAAESLGSRYRDKKVGTFGVIGILSFNGNKIITTSGGGALISDNMEYIEKARFLSTQARDEAPHYQHSEIGYNYRMSNVLAGIGRGQMKVLDQRIKSRRDNNSFYRDALKELPGISFQTELPGFYSNFWLTTIFIDPEKTGGSITREELRLKFEKNNIEVRPLWKPMHLQPIYKDTPNYINGTSERLFDLGLCLPSGSNLVDQDKKRVVELIHRILGNKKFFIKDFDKKEKEPAEISVPFSPPRIDEKIIEEVTKTLKSGWITTGPVTRAFENKITQYCKNKHTLCMNSATSGLELVLRWFGVGPGDEVILPAYTYCATANVILRCSAKPVFVDVNPDDLLISVNLIKEKITDKTKVFIPVDLAGLPCDYNELHELINSNEIKNKFKPATTEQTNLGRILILADAAHSFGAEYYGLKTGSLTDVSVFSFHAVKNLTTAEGGAVALNLPEPFDNKEIYDYMTKLSQHGQTRDALSKSSLGEWKYDVIVPGMKANMPDVLASIGYVEITRYDDDMLMKLEWVFDQYTEGFSKYDWAIIPIYRTASKLSSFHIYPLRIKGITEEIRDLVIQKLYSKNVMVNVHYKPVPALTAYSSIGYNIKDYPNSYHAYQHEISLPIFYDITKKQIDYVIDTVVKSVQKFI